jgi:hypothetical protein
VTSGIKRWLLSGDSILPETLEHCTYVLLFELDRAFTSIRKKACQMVPVFSLAPGSPRNVIGQHREVIRDDQIVFAIRPIKPRQAFKLLESRVRHQDIPVRLQPVSVTACWPQSMAACSR